MKTDPELGLRIHQHLKKIGLETPITFDATRLMDDQFKCGQVANIENSFRDIMTVLGLDLGDDSLQDTPKRIAKMFVWEFFRGLDYAEFPRCTTIENKMDAGMVVEKDIKVMSVCEHHFVTIDGLATVAYIPYNKVIGLSKINRIVDFFSRRPQVQERLTNQIWHTLNLILETVNVAVYIDAKHYCVRSRGVEDMDSSTVTSKLGGEFLKDIACRQEFMSIARGVK